MALPGVNTVIKDRFYSLSRTDIPLGPRVVALGTRDTDDLTSDGSGRNGGVDGVADLDPYHATREDWVINAFGEGSQLHRAYLELTAGGAQTIYLVALPSDTAFNDSTASISSANYTSANPVGDLWDDAWSAVEVAQPDIVVPWGRGGHPSEYNDDAATVDDAPLGFYADNSSSNSQSWVKKVADKMAEITSNSSPAFAVMGVKPWVSNAESMTPANVASHLALTNLTSRDLMTNGIYVSVVAAEIRPVGYPTEFGYSNGAAFYAGHIAQLDSWSSPTGKTIFNLERLRYSPTKTQQLSLIDKGVVPVTVNNTRTPNWVDAMTFSKATSDYTRLTTLRIVFDSVQMVRQVSQRFIGEGSTIAARNALDTAISAGLRGMQEAGALISSDFQISYVPAESKALVDLVLRPAFELRNIEVSVSVQL